MYRNLLQRGTPPIVIISRGTAKGVSILNPSADVLPYKGVPAANKPIKPFCDGTHKHNGLTNVRPVRFQVEKSGEYFMCNCKLTNSRPLCDGTHKQVSGAPKDLEATRLAHVSDNSPVYEGVARKLGYKPKNGVFQ
ncbi:hypothetical protein Q1695_014430 [Nippostrongylus brasiliensis]|nr:hypothetical protein Q1695_014430 [Nippostrongylus brasiliensis]